MGVKKASDSILNLNYIEAHKAIQTQLHEGLHYFTPYRLLQ